MVERFVSTEIGNGIFAETDFKAGDFLLEYRGEIISSGEANRRLFMYEKGIESFIFYHYYKGKKKAVNGTFAKGLCRMVNNAKGDRENCKMIMVEHNNIGIH